MPSVLQALDTHWPATATSPEARRALIRWANHHPVLAGMADLGDVLAARHDPEVATDVLAILARLAATDQLAARTLLQALLPGLVRIVGTIGRGDPDAADEIVSIAWERIRTYPHHRPGSVAANVVFDVRKQYMANRPDPRELALCDVPELVATDTSPEDQVLSVLMVEGVADAHRVGFISADVFSLIMRTRVGGERLATVATDQGVSAEVLSQRRWRAERRLRSLPLAA